MVKAIVGGNWGDEGKGKITDLLAGRASAVVRFQGGANAGHTIINEYGRFVLHILPAGVFRPNAINIIGPGVAFSAESFFKELEMLAAGGVPAPKVWVSERAKIVMPYHILLDRWEEARLGGKAFGSTQSGVAPFYADKYLKVGIQVADLFLPALKEKLEGILAAKEKSAKALYGEKIGFPSLLETENYLHALRKRLTPYITNTTALLEKTVAQGGEILLEGQLGALRDPDHGIYPYVTSSSTLAGFGAVGAGLPPGLIKSVVSVVKAYSSCVGAGPFVTELFGPEAERLRRLGGDKGEYGATTGRPRRVGWFDGVASRYGCRLQGSTEIALSLMDVLGYLKEIPVCVAYETAGGRIITDFPVTPLLEGAKPVYEYLPGWQCDVRNIRTFEELPRPAKNYVYFVEKQLGFPVTMISNGPRREDIILR